MTEVDICNFALGRLGEPRITALSDATTAGRACLLHYAITRDSVLRSHRWNFAKARAVLVPEVTAPAFGWKYAFELPEECLRVLEINGSEDGGGEPWEIEGRELLYDGGAINLIYVKRLEDVSKYDVLFVEALALRLAEKLATTIRGSSSQVVDFSAEYNRITGPLAKRIDSNETRNRQGMWPTRSRMLSARQGSGGDE
jgi:hypothetical protein